MEDLLEYTYVVCEMHRWEYRENFILYNLMSYWNLNCGN